MHNEIPLIITLETLFFADRTVAFKINDGDEEAPVTLTVAQVKEMALAISASNTRIVDLFHDLEKAEERIEKLERRLAAIAEE
jgi:hypothetical protein